MLRGIIPANGGGGDVTALTARVTTLENIQYEYEVFTSIASGTSATITFPTGSALVVGEYAGQNAIVTVLDASGRPIDQAAKTAAGAVITATLTVGGTYTLSGTPSAYPVGLVYQLRCSAKDAGNIPLASVIDAIQIEGTMAKQDAEAVAITGGAINAATIGATTAATVRGTTVTATTQFSGPGTGLTGTASGLSIGGNAATATTATNLSGGTVSATNGAFSGNLSIGTTPKAWTNSGRVIEVSAFTSVSQQSNGASNFGFNFVETGANTFSYASTDEACRFSALTDGGFAWFQAASGTLNSAITFTQTMTLAPSGNLGIGIASPAYPLVVNAAASSQIQIRAGNTSDSALLFGDPDAPAIGRITYAHSTDSMSFMVNGSNRATIDSSGNFGIGATPNTSKVVAAGVIESTSGGFKFPDGTTQTTAATGGGGGGVTVKTSTITVSSATYYQYTTSIVDATVSAASHINAWLAPNTDWDGDDLIDYDVILTPQSGTIDVCISAPGPIVGTFTLKYFVA